MLQMVHKNEFSNRAWHYQSPLRVMGKIQTLMGVCGSRLSTGLQFGFGMCRVQSWVGGGGRWLGFVSHKIVMMSDDYVTDGIEY